MMFAIISSVLLFTMTTMPLFWFYFKASRGWYTVVHSTNYKLIK